MKKSEIMKRAWEIRKEAAEKIGCKISEIVFSFCLKQAWAEAKGVNTMTKTEKIKAFENFEIARLKYDRAESTFQYENHRAEMLAKIKNEKITPEKIQELKMLQNDMIEKGENMRYWRERAF